MCSTTDVLHDILHVVISATHETPCHASCGCDVKVGDGGSLSVLELTAELRGADCSTLISLQLDGVISNGTEICSSLPHIGKFTMIHGPSTGWIRIEYQRKSCSDDNNFRMRLSGE